MKLIRRIQRNAGPSDAYNAGSVMIPTGPERSGSAYNAVRSRDKNANASTVTLNKPERSGYIANAVLERCGWWTNAAHGRMCMEREELTRRMYTSRTLFLCYVHGHAD